MSAEAVAPLSRTSCDEHCDEHHALEADWREPLRDAITALAEAYHAGHDRFPWSLCSRDVCRDTAIALGLRS